jgi:hypothetical protein
MFIGFVPGSSPAAPAIFHVMNMFGMNFHNPVSVNVHNGFLQINSATRRDTRRHTLTGCA